MTRKLVTLAALICFTALPAFAQRGPGGPGGPGMGGAVPQIDTSKVTVVVGDVVAFAGGPGVGKPTLVLSVSGKEESYVLGSYRYLAAQKFAPNTHDRVELKLWACTGCPQGSVVAEVKNVTQGTTITLRAADGSPLFAGRGGSGGPGPHEGCCCPYGAPPPTAP
ncbi:MAG TPA: hypothetical protein VLH41_06765 [Thermoanaerobaculia bacterium]|nr:hypothetical protein [Thermoanaerobaculia bacterium]